MTLNPEDWTTAAEAARLMSIEPQRVLQLADDGALDVIRPWPRVTLIGRRSMAEYLAGYRQPKIGLPFARIWLLKHCQAASVQEIDIDTARDRLRDFIEEARPRWDATRKDLWALGMADSLWTTGAAA